MLNFLSIKNIVLIDHIDINFENGLCVLTGETGAGKSIILESFGLVLGSRANFSLRPNNSEVTQVIAAFSYDKNESINKILDEHGIDCSSELILKRQLLNDGKSRAFVNDTLVSVNILKKIGEFLVEIESQFSEQGLLDSSNHIDVLDEFGNYNDLLKKIQKSWENLKYEESNLNKISNTYSKIQEDKNNFLFDIDELEKFDPKESEYQKLKKRKELLLNFEKVNEGLSNVLENISSDQKENIETLISKSIKEIEKISIFLDKDQIKILELMDSFLISIQDFKSSFENFIDTNNEKKDSIQYVDERIYKYNKLSNKHNCQQKYLYTKIEELRNLLEQTEKSSISIQEAKERKKQAEIIFNNLAEEISAKRKINSDIMDKYINNELPDLKLENALFKTQINKLKFSKATGNDSVKFLIRTNPNVPLDELKKISSGGELCRFALAIKVVSSNRKKKLVVFDEVDSGIGGSVASAVGEKLKKLGEDKQIIVVTHSPQVASMGDQHLKVIKKVDVSGNNKTFINKLNRTERINEIARMISGKEITEEAEKAAKKLLDFK